MINNLTAGKGEYSMSQMTKQALANSLKSLLQKKTLNKITIKDIVDDCGVNRQTFYYHFQDVYDLVDWIFHHDFERLLKDYSDYTNWHQGCRRILDYMQENRSLVLNVYHSVNRVQLEDYLKSWLKPILSSIVNEVAQSMEISQENREFVTDVYVLMMVGFFMDFFMEWMEYDMPKDKLGKLDKLFYCMDGSIAYTLGKFEETK